MKRSFAKNTFILTLTSQLLRVIGIFMMAYMSRKIGTEGVGLYQLIVSIYMLAATFASSGIGIAVSRLTAEAVGKSGGRSTSNVLRRAVVISLLLGAFFGIILFLLSDLIGAKWLGDARTVLSVKTLVPGMPFMALTSCLQGYFYGMRKVLKPAGQMIFEQIVRIMLVMLILEAFLPKGLEYACFAIILSCMISEALSCCFGFVLYRIDKHQSGLAVVDKKGMTKKIAHISLPIAVSSYIRMALRTAENTMIPAGLRKFGASSKEALSQFGQIGMVMPIIFFPCGILAAVGTLLIPEVSEAHAVGNMRRVQYIFANVFQNTILLAILFCGIFMAFATDFAQIIYQSGDIAHLLMALAPLVPLIYLDFIVDSMLNGLNQQFQTLKINILDSALRVILIFFLMPKFGMIAYIVILYVSASLNGTLSIRRLLIASRTKIPFADWIIKPLLSIAASAIFVRLLFRFVFIDSTISAWNLALKIILMISVYILLLFVTQCLDKDDVSWFNHMIKGIRR